jgi:hypothetical protein
MHQIISLCLVFSFIALTLFHVIASKNL